MNSPVFENNDKKYEIINPEIILKDAPGVTFF